MQRVQAGAAGLLQYNSSGTMYRHVLFVVVNVGHDVFGVDFFVVEKIMKADDVSPS